MSDDTQERILDAMSAANPDVEGDLMRHLDLRGVGDVVREGMKVLDCRKRGRSRYVQGWRAEGTHDLSEAK